jgi:hypothetical protein
MYFNGQMKEIEGNGTAINTPPKTDTWQTKMYQTLQKSHKHMCNRRQFHFTQYKDAVKWVISQEVRKDSPEH